MLSSSEHRISQTLSSCQHPLVHQGRASAALWSITHTQNTLIPYEIAEVTFHGVVS